MKKRNREAPVGPTPAKEVPPTSQARHEKADPKPTPAVATSNKNPAARPQSKPPTPAVAAAVVAVNNSRAVNSAAREVRDTAEAARIQEMVADRKKRMGNTSTFLVYWQKQHAHPHFNDFVVKSFREIDEGIQKKFQLPCGSFAYAPGDVVFCCWVCNTIPCIDYRDCTKVRDHYLGQTHTDNKRTNHTRPKWAGPGAMDAEGVTSGPGSVEHMIAHTTDNTRTLAAQIMVTLDLSPARAVMLGDMLRASAPHWRFPQSLTAMSDIRAKYLTSNSADEFIKARTRNHSFCLCTDGYVSEAFGKHLIVSTVSCRGKLFMLRPCYLDRGVGADTSAYVVAIEKQLKDIDINLETTSQVRWFMSDRASTNIATVSAVALLRKSAVPDPNAQLDDGAEVALGTQRATVRVADLQKQMLHVPCVGHLLKTVLDRVEPEIKEVFPHGFKVMKNMGHMFYNAPTRRECEKFVGQWPSMNFPEDLELTPESVVAHLLGRQEAEKARLSGHAPAATINDTRWLSSVWMAFVYVSTNWEEMCDFVKKEAERPHPPPSVKDLDVLMTDPITKHASFAELEQYKALCQPMANCLKHFSDHTTILSCDVAKHIRSLKLELARTDGLPPTLVVLRKRLIEQLDTLWGAHGKFFEFAQWLAPGYIYANEMRTLPHDIPSAPEMETNCNIDCLDWWHHYVAAASRAPSTTDVIEFWKNSELSTFEDFREDSLARGVVLDCLHVPPNVTNVDSIFSIEKSIMADKHRMTADHAERYLQMHVASNKTELFDGSVFVSEVQL